MAFRFTYVWFLLDLWHHLYIFSYYHSFKGISSLANYMAKLLWEWKPRFAVALVVRDLLIVTSYTNCDVTSGPVIMRRYVEKCVDTVSISWTYKKKYWCVGAANMFCCLNAIMLQIYLPMITGTSLNRTGTELSAWCKLMRCGKESPACTFRSRPQGRNRFLPFPWTSIFHHMKIWQHGRPISDAKYLPFWRSTWNVSKTVLVIYVSVKYSWTTHEKRVRL